MPNDQYNEVLIVIIAGAAIFLALTGVVTFILLFYQKKKFQHVQQMKQMQQQYTEELLQSKLEMQEETFNTISQEIHDNVGQTLSLAKVQLNIMGQGDGIDRTLFGDVKDNISKAMTDLRDIARSLSSDRIQNVKLPDAIAQELLRIKRAGIIEGNVHVEGVEKDVDERKRLITFRVMQEVLQNIIKHSKASKVTVRFLYSTDKVTIEMEDNGTGFDIEKLDKNTTGLGLQNIVSRTALIGGSAIITSIIDEGTTITITIPYD